MKYLFYISLLSCVSLLSCNSGTFSQIVYEKTFEEISQIATSSGNPNFCVILSNPDCPPCDVLHNALFEEISAFVGDDAIFNIVDVSLPQNKWYGQLIASKGTPAALLFSQRGELKAIIHGTGRASLECIKNAITEELDCSKHLYFLTFPKSIKYENIIQSLNLLLEAKAKLEKKEDATDELKECMQTLYYPYLLWLQIQNEQNKGNKQNVISLARQMLTFQQSMYASLYGDLYLKARYIINPQFDIKDAPMLEIEDEQIDLGECKVGEKIPFSIKLKNTGKDTLQIYDVAVSCSCLELLSEREYSLESGDEGSLHLEFTPDHSGSIERSIVITTNGIEPSRSITVTANARN